MRAALAALLFVGPLACAPPPPSSPPPLQPVEIASAAPAGSGWHVYSPPPPPRPARHCSRTAPGPDGTLKTVEVPCPKVF